MAEPDAYAGWSLSDRLQMLAFEAELAHLPRSLIAALWQAIDSLQTDAPAIPPRTSFYSALTR